MRRLTLIRPDDWHLHLRDGSALQYLVPDTARSFARAIVMPNLAPPITTTRQAGEYRQRILQAVPVERAFEPLMTLYLTDNTPPEEIAAARQSDFVHAVKLYPAGATTNAESGVTDLAHCDATLAAMQELKMPLLVHGEVTDPAVDVFDRETVFIERVLRPLLDRLPDLKVVFEHITTKAAVEFVREAGANVAATITAHHLLYNRNAMFKGGLRPHYYCLPVLKREQHRQALIAAATCGESKFFLGTDSAPHAVNRKESACGCAGIYTAHAALQLYAEAFDAAGALDKLEGFASFHGADFYGLPRNTATVCLVKNPMSVPEHLNFGDSNLVPLRAGESIAWSIDAD